MFSYIVTLSQRISSSQSRVARDEVGSVKILSGEALGLEILSVAREVEDIIRGVELHDLVVDVLGRTRKGDVWTTRRDRADKLHGGDCVDCRVGDQRLFALVENTAADKVGRGTLNG